MRCSPLLFALVPAISLVAGATAQEAAPPQPPPGDATAQDDIGQQAVAQFDVDGDGQLRGPELGRARAFLQALRREVGDRGERAGDRARRLRDPALGDEDRRAVEGERGFLDRPGSADRRPPRRAREGDEGPDMAEPPRDGPMRLFRAFDDDQDGRLSPEEFTGLMGTLRDFRGAADFASDPPRRNPERRVGPPPGNRPPRRPDGRGFDDRPGAPPEFGDEDSGGPPDPASR